MLKLWAELPALQIVGRSKHGRQNEWLVRWCVHPSWGCWRAGHQSSTVVSECKKMVLIKNSEIGKFYHKNSQKKPVHHWATGDTGVWRYFMLRIVRMSGSWTRNLTSFVGWTESPWRRRLISSKEQHRDERARRVRCIRISSGSTTERARGGTIRLRQQLRLHVHVTRRPWTFAFARESPHHSISCTTVLRFLLSGWIRTQN